ncbi:MAG: Cytochrome c biogenesis protein [Caldanaerobacter subterraneus]|uniref:Cytochrome c biogenesis protein n=4 Tax=Caldanaerobacter subterraneus TaxID=911092 RepID=Q8RB03_CALS4|nr:cytochrome c biogenesis protein CcdA [Caldanaerobacter subterraneus]AAM24279.1 Cytochrome c biogenesis protein [Caldanaerobacter subterraneus subsp. tengcongensis MB4]ERM90861.1 cytochrome C biogenesis protein DsbD [Caldanaerobacter subterraneus subsp. yonseiensis KB-1]KKC29824.1 cytochrome c biogenesis protein [Caldanaerobacter subterraneus subsp. pacificus DSM 12653]KUK08734.1 MAG: Cytochrome c biogenesis protein [Caldanaerobacter subterraneus]MCS3916192.1 cytochrome c-type biogenesis pro
MPIYTAFAAGIVSFLSPCVLPLIPAYVSYIFGNRKNNIVNLILFVLGFSLIFVLMGATASQLGKLFLSYKDAFRKISGIIIVIFGLQMTGLFRPLFLNKEVKLINMENIQTGYIGSFILGVTFAAGWTPCVGPILASILLYASSVSTLSVGVILLFAYSMGLGIPFIVTALLIDKFKTMYKKINKILPYIEVASGVILIIFGILLYFNMLIKITGYLY